MADSVSTETGSECLAPDSGLPLPQRLAMCTRNKPGRPGWLSQRAPMEASAPSARLAGAQTVQAVSRDSGKGRP
jgi:hypothetical protein